MSTAIARASQNKLNMQLKLMEQQRAAQAKAVKAQTTEVKRRQSTLDGFDFTNMTLDGRNRLKADLEYMDENMANMSAQEFGRRIRQIKTNVAVDQGWYKQASGEFDKSLDMMDPVARERANDKLDGFEIIADTEDYRRKSILLESPISAREDFQGQYDPATFSYITPQGPVPVTDGIYYNSAGLQPTMRELVQYNNLTELYNNQKRGSAKTYKDRMASSKTEKVEPSYYDQSAVSAYHDVIWKKKHNRRSLMDEYQENENALSSDVQQILLDPEVDSKVDALKSANAAGLGEEDVKQINDLYDYGLKKTKEWGMQSWRPFRPSSSGSGATTSREPAISQSGLIPFSNFSYGGDVEVSETLNIREAGGFRAFDSAVKIKDTGGRNARSNIESADLNLRAFAMDSKYRLHVHLSVPQKVNVYKYNGSEYTSAQAVREAKEAMYDTTPMPSPQERTVYQDQFLVLRPFNMINAERQYVPSQWGITSSEEDDLYNNVLRKIGHYSLTAKGREETGQEGMARIGFKYLKDIYNK